MWFQVSNHPTDEDLSAGDPGENPTGTHICAEVRWEWWELLVSHPWNPKTIKGWSIQREGEREKGLRAGGLRHPVALMLFCLRFIAMTETATRPQLAFLTAALDELRANGHPLQTCRVLDDQQARCATTTGASNQPGQQQHLG